MQTYVPVHLNFWEAVSRQRILSEASVEGCEES